MEEAPRSASQQMAAVDAAAAEPSEGVVLQFPDAQQPQQLGRVTLRKAAARAGGDAPNDLLQPVAGVTRRRKAPEPRGR